MFIRRDTGVEFISSLCYDHHLLANVLQIPTSDIYAYQLVVHWLVFDEFGLSTRLFTKVSALLLGSIGTFNLSNFIVSILSPIGINSWYDRNQTISMLNFNRRRNSTLEYFLIPNSIVVEVIFFLERIIFRFKYTNRVVIFKVKIWLVCPTWVCFLLF